MKKNVASCLPSTTSRKPVNELIIIALLAVIVFICSWQFDIIEQILDFMEKYEKYELDEIVSVMIFLAVALSVFSYRRLKEAKHSQNDLSRQCAELEKALLEIKQLKGILPICASCKKVRNDKGYWQQVEVYLQKVTDAEFSHGLCPDCAEHALSDLEEYRRT